VVEWREGHRVDDRLNGIKSNQVMKRNFTRALGGAYISRARPAKIYMSSSHQRRNLSL
jgi:hypothetical protein